MKGNFLKITPKNTEVFYISSFHTHPEDSVKYLGIVLDPRLTFKDHIKYVISKATRALACQTPNMGCPKDSKRRILAGVVRFIIQYIVPIWFEILKIIKYSYVKIVSTVDGRAAITTAATYRMVSEDLAAVTS